MTCWHDFLSMYKLQPVPAGVPLAHGCCGLKRCVSTHSSGHPVWPVWLSSKEKQRSGFLLACRHVVATGAWISHAFRLLRDIKKEKQIRSFQISAISRLQPFISHQCTHSMTGNRLLDLSKLNVYLSVLQTTRGLQNIRFPTFAICFHPSATRWHCKNPKTLSASLWHRRRAWG